MQFKHSLKAKYLGYKFNSAEISGQEAFCCCLGLALLETSNMFVHINTFPPKQRIPKDASEFY